MRLVGVNITGFGRLRSSSFSADRKLTAILGPNEAGKSTLLRALLALNDDSPVAQKLRNRSMSLDEEQVMVEAEFAVDSDDLIDDLAHGWVSAPTTLIIGKRAGGNRDLRIEPRPVYPAKVWDLASRKLQSVLKLAGDELSSLDDLSEEDNAARELISRGIRQLREQLDAKEILLSVQEFADLTAAMDSQAHHFVWFKHEEWQKFTATVEPLIGEGERRDALRSHLASRVPRFELFTEEDRGLRHEYLLEDLGTHVPKALQNLLSLANTTLTEVLPNQDLRTAVATAQETARENLAHIFSNAWKQHPIEVHFSFEADYLILLVKDQGKIRQSIAFDERSDGLRTFVALTAFLATRGGLVPPILLIDEAEARLHWDAQADLVSVLQSSNEVGQILYTTHSPGCLPPDLGTGIIFVKPDAKDPNASTVRRDFWNASGNESFGMAPLLFMMGAGAAAFSRVRRAVVAEGPSDMMLLPTLFRAATKLAELDFQVVPGISTTSKEQLHGLADTGVRVAYLVDGDAQGVEWRRQLEEHGQVSPSRIKSLPVGLAAEDLFDKEFYVSVFVKLLGRTDEVASLALGPGPLKPQLEALCGAWGCTPPTTIEVADAILANLDAARPGAPDHQRVKLAKGAGVALRRLHEEFVSLLG